MNLIKKFNNNRALLFMALPGLIWYLMFCYLPMFGIVIGFQDFDYNAGFLGSRWVGLSNFKYLFSTSDAFTITRNTILYNLFFIAFNVFSSVSLAVIFNILERTGLNRFNQTAVLLPHFLSWVVASYFVFAILSVDKGIANKVVRFFGGSNINWYAEPKYWPVILFVCNEWKRVGYSSIIYYSTIRGFDSTYYEVAKIDGATWFQCILHITLPLLKPIIIIMLILNIGSIMHSDFGLFYIIPKNSGMLYSVTSTIDTYIYNGMTGIGDLGATAAAGFYQSLVGFILVMLSNGIVKKLSPDDALF